MEKIHQDLQNVPEFVLVSFTLDSKRDTPEKLFTYAYYAAAYNDKTREKDNIMHDGVLVLVGTKGHIRGMYDGMDKSTVPKVKQDVRVLLKD